MCRKLILCLLLEFAGRSYGQEILNLWKDVPNKLKSKTEETVENGNIQWIQYVQEPTLEIYIPTKQIATGQAVLICPGGGYAGLAYDWEGTDIAKWLNSMGVAAFALKNRLPDPKDFSSSHEVPLQDAQRAIRIIRSNMQDWNLEPGKIGVMGFSAGGHLASTLSTQYDSEVYQPVDDIDTLSAKPDFSILIYPVITMDTAFTHMGSRFNLIGENPSIDLERRFSNELQVNDQTPPTYLLHSSDDGAVHVENSLRYYRALQQHQVPVEMHIYPFGGHGYALGLGREYLAHWPATLRDWLLARN